MKCFFILLYNLSSGGPNGTIFDIQENNSVNSVLIITLGMIVNYKQLSDSYNNNIRFFIVGLHTHNHFCDGCVDYQVVQENKKIRFSAQCFKFQA